MDAVSFGPRTDVGAGTSPHTSVLADVNNDQRPDVIVTSEGSGFVSVFINTTPYRAATPSFAPRQDFAVGSLPVSVATADFNADGRLDLAVANAGSDSLSVMLNTTTPLSPLSFSAPFNLTTGSRPRFVAAGDFNGDGKSDLASANFLAHTISVFLNTTPAGSTTPSFAPREDFGAGLGPVSLAVSDINQDGRVDLAVANHDSNNVSILLNTTAPGGAVASFSAAQNFATGTTPRYVAAGDLNGDGRADLVTANHGGYGTGLGSTISVLMNTTSSGGSSASFAPKQDFEVGLNPIALAVVDMNNDVRADVAVANFSSDTISVLLNTSGPGSQVASFQAQTVDAGDAPIFVSVADLNADGFADLAGSNYLGNSLSVMLNTTATQARTSGKGIRAPAGARFASESSLFGSTRVADSTDDPMEDLLA